MAWWFAQIELAELEVKGGVVIERIVRHLGLWQEECSYIPAPTRRAKRPSIHGSTTPAGDNSEVATW